jgi:hypothetical protein
LQWAPAVTTGSEQPQVSGPELAASRQHLRRRARVRVSRPLSAANSEGPCQQGSRSPGDGPRPRIELGAVATRSKPASSPPAVPPMCPKQRFTAVGNGQQRSAAVAPELHQRPWIGGRTVLPKLAVLIVVCTLGSSRHGSPAIWRRNAATRSTPTSRPAPLAPSRNALIRDRFSGSVSVSSRSSSMATRAS